MLGHQNSLLENNPKAHFHFSAETTPTQDVVIYSDPLDFITTILDPPYKDPYVDMGIEQRAREMTHAEPRIFISVHLYRNICLKTQKYLLIKIKSSMWPTYCQHETQMLANTNEWVGLYFSYSECSTQLCDHLCNNYITSCFSSRDTELTLDSLFIGSVGCIPDMGHYLLLVYVTFSGCDSFFYFWFKLYWMVAHFLDSCIPDMGCDFRFTFLLCTWIPDVGC